jgi:hypothetical protein
MVEVLVAVAILGFGVLSSLAVFCVAGRFAGDAARGSTACRLASAVLEYASAYPNWATSQTRKSEDLPTFLAPFPYPFVTPADGLVWKLEAKKDPSDGADPSLLNVWILRLKVAEDFDNDGEYDDDDWDKGAVRPRGFVGFDALDCTCETYVYKKP